MPEEPKIASPPFSRLYPILDAALEVEEGLAERIRALARAGCRSFQLRAKELSGRDFHRWALRAREVSRETGMLFVVNDRADVALLVGADGAHVGQDDLSPRAARRVLGERAILGLSTHDLAQARTAAGEPVDYVAIGPIYQTRSKKSPDPPLGIEGLRKVRQAVDKPLVAIGGITLENAKPVLEAGADAVAVISALHQDRDLESTARKWLNL